jgi:hypothetical protein
LLSQTVIPLLLGLGCVVAAPARGFAEVLQQEFQQDSSDFSAAVLTPPQWRQRVEDARRRSEEFVAQARSHTIHSIQSDLENAELTGQLAMSDPSLKPGDIASTSHGFLVFIGRDGAERRPDDLADSANPSGTISVDGQLEICRIGRVVERTPLALFYGPAHRQLF